MKNEFYVYVYLDPRKKGEFKYGEYEFEYEPFYIGKGSGNRITDHLEIYENHQTPFYTKLGKIIDLKPITLKIKEFDSEKDAYNFEESMIKTIGSTFINDINDGPLFNMCIGSNPPNHKGKTYKEIYGDRADEERKKRHDKQLEVGGFFKGHKHSKHSKKKISESITGDKNPMYGKKHTKESLEKMSKVKIGMFDGDKNPNAKTFWVINTNTGEGYHITGKLKQFCKEKNISHSTLKNTLKSGKPVSRGKTKDWLIKDVY